MYTVYCIQYTHYTVYGIRYIPRIQCILYTVYSIHTIQYMVYAIKYLSGSMFVSLGMI